MRTPNPPWMSLSRTIGIKSAEKQRIRAGKLPAGSIPAPFEALGKTGGGLSCRKTASPRSTGHRAAGGRCPHGQPPFSPFQSRPAGQGFLCSSRPHPAVCGLPHFPPQQSEIRIGFPVFSPAAVVGHIHKLSPVLHCRTRLCVGFPFLPQQSEMRKGFPFLPPPRKSFIPAQCAGMAEVAGGEKNPTFRRPQFLF